MAEEVEEEMMALEAIFYDSFSKLDNNRFRLRIDPNLDNDDVNNNGQGPPPLFLEILLPDGYPQIIPEFDISNINNIKYSEPAKKAILEGLHDQASNQAGENMCYNLAEWLKEKLPEFFALKNVSATMDHDGDMLDASIQSNTKNAESIKKEVKEKMTKAQKRRFFDRFGAAGEKPRGWNWVSIISHVSCDIVCNPGVFRWLIELPNPTWYQSEVQSVPSSAVSHSKFDRRRRLCIEVEFCRFCQCFSAFAQSS